MGPILNRRAALAALATSIAVGWAPKHVFAQVEGSNALAALVDTLIPGDDLSPSASALAVDAELLQTIAHDPRPQNLVALGLQWLDSLADKPFAERDQATREQNLSIAAAAGLNEGPRRFYILMRTLTLQIYYTKPDVLGGLPLHPAPQPDGYPPPWN